MLASGCSRHRPLRRPGAPERDLTSRMEEEEGGSFPRPQASHGVRDGGYHTLTGRRPRAGGEPIAGLWRASKNGSIQCELSVEIDPLYYGKHT